MGNRPIIAALGAPVLAATMLGLAPTAAVAAPETPYHPTVLWATSEEKVGESAPNGTIAALTDDDSGRTDATKTFWTTKWKGGLDTYPHALAVQNPTPGTQVCGLGLTPRTASSPSTRIPATPPPAPRSPTGRHPSRREPGRAVPRSRTART